MRLKDIYSYWRIDKENIDKYKEGEEATKGEEAINKFLYINEPAIAKSLD